MEVFDISMTIGENMPVYKNKSEKKPRVAVIKDFTQSDSYESRIDMDAHTGTHVDAPLHMVPGGDTVDRLDVTRFFADCVVLDLKDAAARITADDLRGKVRPGLFVLLKTKNSYVEGFDPEFAYLDSSGAGYLREMKVSGVGIDALGIERAQPGHETHKILLESGIAIIEGLRLAEIEEGPYTLIALPLKIGGAEASPVRAVLIR